MKYPRNVPYTIEELDEDTRKTFGNYKKEWKDRLSKETLELIKFGKRITTYEFNQMRGNSYDWKAIYPLLDDEALLMRIKYVMENCTSIKDKNRYSVNSTYEEELLNSLVPLLMDRMEEQEAELHKLKEDAKEAVRTSWRVVDNIPKTKEAKEWPFAGFVKSAKHHLTKIDYIFEDKEEHEHTHS